MKKTYTKAAISIIEIRSDDVITLSGLISAAIKVNPKRRAFQACLEAIKPITGAAKCSPLF